MSHFNKVRHVMLFPAPSSVKGSMQKENRRLCRFRRRFVIRGKGGNHIGLDAIGKKDLFIIHCNTTIVVAALKRPSECMCFVNSAEKHKESNREKETQAVKLLSRHRSASRFWYSRMIICDRNEDGLCQTETMRNCVFGGKEL